MLESALARVGTAEWSFMPQGTNDVKARALLVEFSAALIELGPIADSWLSGEPLPSLNGRMRYFLALALRKALDDLATCEGYGPANPETKADFSEAVRWLLFDRWTEAEVESWVQDCIKWGILPVYAPGERKPGGWHPFRVFDR